MTAPPARPPAALYHRDGDRYVPGEHAGGPWSADAQHGGPPGGLLAREAERRAAALDGAGPAPLPARHTVDLFRPVPMRPLEVGSGVIREGRRIAVVESTLWCEGVALARATTVFLRPSAFPDPREPDPGAHLDGAPPRLAGPEALETGSLIPRRWADRLPPGFHFAVEARWLADQPHTAWFRMPMPLVAGEPVTAFQRVAVIADLGNAVSAGRRQAGGVAQFSMINVEFTLHLVALPRGEWVALRSSLVAGRRGLGFARVDVYGLDGWSGSVTQASLGRTPDRGPGERFPLPAPRSRESVESSRSEPPNEPTDREPG